MGAETTTYPIESHEAWDKLPQQHHEVILDHSDMATKNNTTCEMKFKTAEGSLKYVMVTIFHPQNFYFISFLC